jgi:hypothetical protein
MTLKRFKERWVCFDCRKMFRYLRRVENAMPGVKPESSAKSCSKCGAAMYNIGSFFVAPSKSNGRLWDAAKIVAASGYHCHSTSASRLFWQIAGSGALSRREVFARMAKSRIGLSEGSRLLARIRKKS